MILSAVFGLVPWYVWAIAIAAIVAVSMLGLWPVLLAILRTVPRQVWIALGVLVAIALAVRGVQMAIEAHDNGIRKTAVDERDAVWKAREKDANDRYNAQLDKLYAKLDAADTQLRKVTAEAAVKLARERAAADQRFSALEAQRSTNVSQAAIDACHLTRGVILQFNAGARAANGEPEPAAGREAAAGSGPESADGGSGVPLDRYAAAVEATQRALGTCRSQVDGWQAYHRDVILPWIASTTEAFASCIPKGTP